MVASLFTILLISLWTTGNANKLQPRPVIVGGLPIKIKEAPFMAMYRADDSECGASILSERFLLSAAHCYSSSAKEVVVVGTDNINNIYQYYPVEKSIIHPKFGSRLVDELDYDVMVLKLSVRLKFSKRVQPITMAEPDSVIQSGSNMAVFGFGETEEECSTPPILRKVVIPYISSKKCSEILDGTNIRLTKRMICAGRPGKDSCPGDSGGPLVYNNTLVGVVSFGPATRCGAMPGVYAKVSALRDFIDDAIWRNS